MLAPDGQPTTLAGDRPPERQHPPGGEAEWVRGVGVVFDEKTLALGPFLWFGGLPGQPLPDTSSFPLAKHTKGNAQGVKAVRPNIRVLKWNVFQQVSSVPELVERLFGAVAVAPNQALQQTAAAVSVSGTLWLTEAAAAAELNR